ncbi:MAG: integral rane sensor signal transduction histidine kinase, partial [Chitinophagaceae bacterium]|nr:integral rane sensor signal transduction histidine kinase [Chitinophagaceae bacterium]
MPIRLRITFLFAAIATLLLVLVGSTVYIISKTNRTNHIKTRLINRAITTARLLQSETFDHEVITKIDLLTASALKNKTVQAYDRADARIYMFSDRYADTIAVSSDVLTQAREKGNTYF